MQQELQATDANHASNVVNQPVFLGEVQQAAGLKVKIWGNFEIDNNFDMKTSHWL